MITEKFYIGYSEMNKEFKLSNVGLMNLFQDIATIHGTKANDSLKTHDSCWFITAYKVKIEKRPDYENFVNLSTWSRGIRGCLASREFEIKDESGNLMVSALSNWIRINKHTQKIERITPEIVTAYTTEEHTNFGYEWLEKLQECEKIDAEYTFTADRNYVDVHKHVNNVAYLKYANLVMPNDVFEKPEPLEFEIMYRKAIQLSETFKCLWTETENFYNVSFKSTDGSELYAIVRFYK